MFLVIKSASIIVSLSLVVIIFLNMNGSISLNAKDELIPLVLIAVVLIITFRVLAKSLADNSKDG